MLLKASQRLKGKNSPRFSQSSNKKILTYKTKDLDYEQLMYGLRDEQQDYERKHQVARTKRNQKMSVYAWKTRQRVWTEERLEWLELNASRDRHA